MDCKDCLPTTAYKDISGNLHESQEKCNRENLRIKESRFRQKIENIFNKILSMNTDRYYSNRNGMSEGYVLSLFTPNWKQIRDDLNKVEELV